MNTELFTTLVIVAIIVAMAILILIGHGDWLISGYNTASPEERAQYNVRRLRLIMGVGSLVIAALMAVDAILHLRWLIFAGVLPICILILILGNTWAKS